MSTPHRRQNLLTGDWVLVSPQRALRPWQGQVEATAIEARPTHDPGCYLCPGNVRVGGVQNPPYDATFVFDNDFPALLDEPGSAPEPSGAARSPGESSDAAAPPGLFQAEPVRGTCRVMCFSPRHDQTLADLSLAETRRVVTAWQHEVAQLGRRYAWVQVFENKGAVMGCSNPHPHGQIWALDALPNEARKELAQQRAYHAKTGRSLLLDVAAAESASGERVVLENDEWLVVVPHWALWPFETLLLPRRPTPHLPALTDEQGDALADALGRLLRRYDNLFGTSFPYSMGFHGAPCVAGDDAGAPLAHDPIDAQSFQLHAHFYPPLLRSATVKKFMVGFEMLGEGQRDLTPEQAAAALRACAETPL